MYSIGRDGNIIEVNRKNPSVFELTPYYFIADASDINFHVGYAPRRIRTNLGNKQDFIFSEMDKEHKFIIYKQLGSRVTLKVFNT